MELHEFVKSEMFTGKESEWTCGITNNPKRRYSEHGSPKYWGVWGPYEEKIVRELEAAYKFRGCKGDKGGGDPENPPAYIYFFKG